MRTICLCVFFFVFVFFFPRGLGCLPAPRFVFPFAFLGTTFCSKIKETILKVISCKCDLSQRSEFIRDNGVTIELLSLESVGDEKKRRGGEEERRRGGEEERR